MFIWYYGVLLFWLLPACIFIINVITWRRYSQPQDSHVVSVSVLIPARNEENCIQKCVESVSRSTYNIAEIIVYNDQSTDRTQEILEKCQETIPKLKILNGVDLPKGWAGKNHACHQLYNASKGEILLFLDADTSLFPNGLEQIVNTMNRNGLKSDLLSCLPKQKMISFGEKLVMPLLHITLLSWLPLILVRLSSFVSCTAAIGQVIAIRRCTYVETGGFESIKNSLLDDIDLAKLCKSQNHKICFIDGHDIAECRMYKSLYEIWNGFTKNIFVGLNFSITLLFFTTCAYSLAFIIPFIVPFLNLDLSLFLTWGGMVFTLLARLWLTLRYEQSFWTAILQPVAVIILIGIAMNSFLHFTFSEVTWKGRKYSNV